MIILMIGMCHHCNQDKADMSYVDILLKNREKTVLLCQECKESEFSGWDYVTNVTLQELQSCLMQILLNHYVMIVETNFRSS